jgi:3-oxoadipate enol-lactonase
MATPPYPPEPPIALPPARTVTVRGRGEFFLRDTGGDGPAIMLLHGWMATADLNWCGAYHALEEAGYRVLAIDHRGHGRGLRALTPFRLADCADDAAAVLRELGIVKATIVGYSMGGAIAQLVAQRQPDVASGVVLSGTAQHWQDRRAQREFRGLGVLGLALTLAPRATLRAGLRRSRMGVSPLTVWLQSELERHLARDLVEAGRELGRFDSRPWLGSVAAPISVLITTRDELVAPFKHRELAAAAGGPVFETPLRHMQLVSRAREYNPRLIEAIASVSPPAAAAAA